MQALLSIFQSAGDMLAEDRGFQKILGDLPFPVESYNMTVANKSSFLDIGSGFGKPVVHSAMQTGCYSRGVEIVPARVLYCESYKYD